MLSRILGLALGFCVFGLAALTANAADQLRFTTETYPPFNFPAEDGKVIGISTDLLRAAAERAGIAIAIDLLPWQRAYNEALTVPGTCVYSTTLTEERKPMFKWVAPLVQNDWVLFGVAGSAPKVAAIADAKPYLIGVYQGDAIEKWFHQQGGYRLEAAVRDDLNPSKLAAQRMELWATGSLSGPWFARKAGVSGLERLLTFNRTELGLACNRDIPDALIAKLDTALKAMRSDGAAATIEARYR